MPFVANVNAALWRLVFLTFGAEFKFMQNLPFQVGAVACFQTVASNHAHANGLARLSRAGS